jgi:predicted phage-related endonuclease
MALITVSALKKATNVIDADYEVTFVPVARSRETTREVRGAFGWIVLVQPREPFGRAF